MALLGSGPVPESLLLETLPPHTGHEAKLALGQAIEFFARAGILRRVMVGTGGTFATIEPLGEYYRFSFAAPLRLERALRLVRFCLIRPDSGRAVLESPLSPARVWLDNPIVAGAIASLASARSIADVSASCPGVPVGNLRGLLSMLIAEGFLVYTENNGQEVDRSLPLSHWEFHDLLFHSRSRRGRHGGIVGASFRFKGKTSAPPGVKPPMSAYSIPLPRPDMQALFVNDMPLPAALELRASIREPAARAISLTQLGEFLYRTARIRHRSTFEGIEFTRRPYPSGGASYELEIYPVVDRCIGLLSGAYHYDPVNHTLEPLVPANGATARLIFDAYTANARNVWPNVLLVITARFQRVSWKYESIAYATILKDVGILYQTMYLVATAMKLAPCAIGAGDSDLFCLLLNNDYYEEGAVGEFMLGAR